MSENKYVSDVKIIPHPIEAVFNHLSDFTNLSKYFNEEILASIADKVPQVNIREFQADRDSCSFEIGGIGRAEIRIVERTPFSTIKVEGQGNLPVELKFWIQLLPLGTGETKLRLTLHAEMGMMIRMMVGNKLEKGINQLADALTLLPYA
jgi:carbon monoxide dehydrogenase subunit G